MTTKRPVKDSPKPKQAKDSGAYSAEANVPDPTEISLAAATLFRKGGNKYTLTNGVEVVFKEAGLKQIRAITDFFNLIANALTPKEIAQIIDLIVGHQTKAISEGRDPLKIDIGSMATEDIVRVALTNLGVASTVLGVAVDALPGLMAAFCNQTQEEIEEMGFDSQQAIILGIVAYNYSFFIRSLLPTFQAFAQAWASENSGKLHIVKKIMTQTAGS